MVEAEVDQLFEVDHGGSGGECDLVALDTSVAAASVSVGDEPGDDAFDHRPVLSVVVDQVGVESPWDGWRLSCALGFARSACLIAGRVVGVTKLVLDRAEHAE